MIDVRSCIAMLVIYRTWPWTAIGVGSFQERFPDLPLLVVDNNPDETDPVLALNRQTELQWLRTRSNLEVIRNRGPNYFHGSGINLALEYCRLNAIEYLLHLEPDCLITGRRWFETLSEPLENGAWMAGSVRSSYGPIHPTPSLWRFEIAWGSFSHQPRAGDVDHERFSDVFHLSELLDWVRVHEPHAVDYWTTHWDTAQRNWFLAAVEGRAAQVEPAADFQHYWYGSRRGPDLNDPQLARFF